jgi:hypothetical protein
VGYSGPVTGLLYLYYLLNIYRVIKLVRGLEKDMARIGEWRGAYRVLVGKREARSSFGIPKHKWEDNIRMGFHKVG